MTLFLVVKRALIAHAMIWQNIFTRSPNQQLKRRKELDEYVYSTFKHFWKTNEYSGIGWLLLISLDEVVLKKDDLRDLNVQVKHHINNLRASMRALKKTFISYSCRAKTAENQMQYLTLRMAKLQCKVNFQLHRMSTAKVRTLIGKEWDLIIWDGDLWRNPYETRHIKLLNSNEFSLSVEVALSVEETPPPPSAMVSSPRDVSTSLPSSEGINPALLQKVQWPPLRQLPWEHYADASQDPPPLPHFVFRPITRPKFQQAPKGEVQSVTHEVLLHHSPK